MKRISQILFIGLVLFGVSSCQKDFGYYFYSADQQAILDRHLNLPSVPDDYEVVLPTHLTATGLFTRRVSDQKAILGRVLFYDESLSKDGTVSCASCHHQDKGFADNKAFSRGIEDNQTTRNSFALGSVVNFSAYYGTDINGTNAVRFFWDNRAETASAQARGSITNPVEMGMHMEDVVEKVKNTEYYGPLFEKAYDLDPSITEDKILGAIQDFVNAMGSFDSKFDQEAQKLYSTNDFGMSKLHNDFSGYTAAENNGKELYMTNCASCHSENMGRPTALFASNGLDLNPTDLGVGSVTNNQSQMGTFKVPTLRNIQLTGPYMHDGRFNSLEEVIDFYSSGVQSHVNLDNRIPTGGFNFSQTQKSDLIAFLNTLTDNSLATQSKFSNPFK